MSQTKDAVVRVQTLSGAWENLGSDRAHGIWPEGVTATADHWGPSKASFSLHRDPGVAWPDIAAFTPVEIEIGGVLVWDGRIKETPMSQSSRVINVQCEGWQYHLDDDVYQRAYVHAKLADYKDVRGMPGAPLGASAYNAAGQVTADGGQVYLAWTNGTPLVANAQVGAIVDLGSAGAKRVVLSWESSNNTAALQFYIQGTNTPSSNSGVYENLGFIGLNSGPSGTSAFTFTSTWRYLSVNLYNPAFVGATGADHWIKFTAIKVFADTAYESANESVLKATAIIPDALDRATLLLSDDRSGIDPDATVTFAFPEFAPDGAKTAREIWSAANAVHDYDSKIAVRRRPIFRPKPSAALVEIGEWPGCSVEDASANSGEEIYNRVIVEGTTANGEKLVIERAASQGADVVGEPVTSPAPNNPSFATDTTSWTAAGGSTITRETTPGLYDTFPASGRWERTARPLLAAGDTLTETFTGTFLAGTAYILTIRLRARDVPTVVDLEFGATGDRVAAAVKVPDLVFATSTVTWTPTADQTAVTMLLRATTDTLEIYVDSLSLAVAKPTLVDRRGFRRTHILSVKNSLTPELGAQIGDVWLDAHRTTPFKGSARIAGDRAAREIATGRSVPPEQLLLRTGELLRLADRIDPDTGGHGRDGRIAEVTYSANDNSASVALDSRRTSHEALLERLAVVVGST